jgi:hypothetical protein
MLLKASTAASGVRNTGMCLLLSRWRAERTVASPIQQPSTGLECGEKTSPTAAATASASVPALGEKISSTPSTLRSATAACMAAT